MTCKRVEKALPLFVGRDLDPSRMASVAGHLVACEPCRSLQVELASSRAWLEASPAPPASEGDYATMRRAVWSRIETGAGAGKGASARAGRLLLASSGALAAAFVAILVLRARPQIPRETGRTAPAPREEVAMATPSAKPLEEPPSPPAPPKLFRHGPSAPVRPAARGAESSVARIEFQTANPDVRIIWLVKKGETAPAARPASRNEEVL